MSSQNLWINGLVDESNSLFETYNSKKLFLKNLWISGLVDESISISNAFGLK